MTSARTARVSVVIPCFNQGRYLADAITSAVARDAAVEIIVVDDGSWDDTQDVAARFAHVRYVRQPNRGLAAARNRGVEESSGAFVIFLDADDTLLTGAIDTGVRALMEHPDCALAYGRCVMMGPDGSLWPTPGAPAVRSGHHMALLRTNLIWMPAMAIVRRDVVSRLGGFRPGFDGAADYDLYLRIARNHAIHDHEQMVAAYRRHPDCMSGNAARMLRETLAVMRANVPDDDADLAAAWRDGYRNWQDFYGTQLVEEMRRDLRAYRFWKVTRNSAVLLRFAPWVFARELRRKLLRRPRDAGRGDLLAEPTRR